MLPVEFGAARHTERLRVRMMTLDDVDDVHAYQGRVDVCRYLPYEARSRDQVVERITRWSAATRIAETGDFWQVAVELPGADRRRARVIGEIYFTVTSAENLGGEIGWVFHPDFTGRGYAREAASAVLDRAFGDLGLHRVMAQLDPRNTSSVRLCSALGMREEALFVGDLLFRGEWTDTGVHAVLDREWAARADR